MNVSRYIWGSLVVWVFIFLIEALFHGVILSSTYEGIKHLLRPEGDSIISLMWILLGELLLAFGFCYIFIKGYENKGIAEGFRYGLLIGITFAVSSTLIRYAVHPIPNTLAAAEVVGYPIEMILAGMIFAAIYKPLPTGQ